MTHIVHTHSCLITTVEFCSETSRIEQINWKALRHGKYEPGGLSCSSTLKICHDMLKSANLLLKQGFDDSKSPGTIFTLPDKWT